MRGQPWCWGHRPGPRTARFVAKDRSQDTRQDTTDPWRDIARGLNIAEDS